MLSERNIRSLAGGFTILESMLAFVLLGVVLIGVYSLAQSAVHQQHRALIALRAAEHARALLDEYIVTYPAMPRQGTYKGSWSWTISESPQPPLRPSRLNPYFEFVKVTAFVSKPDTPEAQSTLSTVVARPAPAQ